MKILYKNVLNLELWHDFYLGQPNPPPGELPVDYDISPVVSFVPTVSCLQILQNLRWVFRPRPSGASLFANVANVNDATNDAPDDAPSGQFRTVVPIDRPYRLTFWLVVRDRHFANYTNLPLTEHRHQIYYFSNLWNNQGHGLFLTRPLSAYAANATYSLGQLVTHNNQTLEAVRPLQQASSNPEANDWDMLAASQYVSASDRLSRQGQYYTHTIASANPEDIVRLTLVDGNGEGAFAVDATVPDNHSPGASLPISLNLTGLLPGRYQLQQDGTLTDEFVVVDSTGVQNAFALVELFLNPNVIAPAFALVQSQAGQTLIQPRTYVIRFKNRATRWRYRYEKKHGCSATTLPDAFTLVDDYTYATTRPIGLRHYRESLNGCKDKPLPAPSVSLIKPETNVDHQVANIFSDVYL